MVDTLDRLRGVRTSVAFKAPVNAKSTGNITLSGFQTLDGISLSSVEGLDARVLVNAQDNAVENGIYEMASGAWARTADFDGTDDAAAGTLVFVRNGTAYANSIWRCATANPVEIDTDEILFTQVGITGTDGDDGVNGLFAGTETVVTARTTDLVPLQDASNGSTAARASAQSIAETGRAVVQMQPFGFTEEVTTGERVGGIGFMVPVWMDGFQVVAVHGRHFTAGSGAGNTSLQITKSGSTGFQNLLSVPLTIDAGELAENTAATTYVIAGTSVSLVDSYQYLMVDVNSVPATTAPQGLTVSIDFQKPATT